MAVSRVNFIASNFSYAPSVTKGNFIDTLTKFMVSGIGPFTIEKIEVVDKVARVTTTEKNFISLPGVKLSIDGTGNTSVDDRHELIAVFFDGFSFEVDTPDAVWTNGVTYSVPSLGWSLIKQTSVQSIFRSSTDAVIPFYLIITVKGAQTSSYPDERYNYHQVQLCYKLTEDLIPINPYPQFFQGSNHVLPIHQYTAVSSNTLWNYRALYYFYGDGAVINVAADFRPYTADEIKTNIMWGLASTSVGEARGISNALPYHYICGQRISAASWLTTTIGIATNAGSATSQAFAGYYGSASTLDTTCIGSKIDDEEIYYADGGITFPRRLTGFYSGYRLVNLPNFITNQSEIVMTPMDLTDYNLARLGEIPGIYALDNRPFNMEGVSQKSLETIVRGIKKRGAYVRASSATSSTNGGGSQTGPANDAIAFIDLTGPIR